MFILNNDIVNSILNSSSFSDSFKDLLKEYSNRDLTAREVNEFLVVFSYEILDDRRIKLNLFDGMLSNERINRLNTMLNGMSRSHNNNTLTNSDIIYIRNTLLKNCIVDESIKRENETIVETVTYDFKPLEERYSALKRELNDNVVNIGVNRLNEIFGELNSIKDVTYEMQNEARFDRRLDDNRLRVILNTSSEIVNTVNEELSKVEKIIDVKEGLQVIKREELTKERRSLIEINSLVNIDKMHLEELERQHKDIKDETVKKALKVSITQTKEKIASEEDIITEKNSRIEALSSDLDVIENGGYISEFDSLNNESKETNDKSYLNVELSIQEQMENLISEYEKIAKKVDKKDLNSIGIIELKEIINSLNQLKVDNEELIKKARNDFSIDTELYNELSNQSKMLDNNIKNTLVLPNSKLNEKIIIYNEFVSKGEKTKGLIKDLEKLIKKREKDLKSVKKNLESTSDAEVKKIYKETIKSIENEISEYKNRLDNYKKELDEIEKSIERINKSSLYKKPSKKSTKKEEKKDDVEVVDFSDDEKPSETKDTPVVAEKQKPIVKYNKPKLTWKTALAVATGIGVGATVFFTTGPAGVAVMSIVSAVGQKVISNERHKLIAKNVCVLDEETPVESIEEPKSGIKEAISKLRKYFRSEEGLRDISWLLTAAVITGNALSISSIVKSKILAKNAMKSSLTENVPTSTQPTNVTPNATAPTQASPELTSIKPDTGVVSEISQANVTPTPTESVYNGIRLGENVGNYNVSVGHRQAIKAFNGTDVFTLNQNAVNSNSVFGEFAIVDDTGKLIQRVSTPGLSLDELCAQYGVKYSNVILDVTKNGTSQAWVSVEELISGASGMGPTI